MNSTFLSTSRSTRLGLLAGALVALSLFVPACSKSSGSSDKKKSADDSEEEAPKKKKRKVPKLPDEFEQKTIDAAVAWLDEDKPVALAGIDDVHLPAGGELEVNTLGEAGLVSHRYKTVGRDKGLVAFLILLSEDQWKIGEWKRAESGSAMFVIEKEGEKHQCIVGAPAGEERKAAILTVFVPVSVLKKKVPLGMRDIVPVKVKAPWSHDKFLSGGKVTKVYGKLGFVKYDDGSLAWQELEKMEPKQTPDLDPKKDKCDFAAGDKVRAPYAGNNDLFPAKVTDTYGHFAWLTYVDPQSNVQWADCDKMKKP